MLGTRIHAPTASVLYQFREIALFGRVTPGSMGWSSRPGPGGDGERVQPVVSDAMSETVARPALDLLDGDAYVHGAAERYAWFREHEPVAWDDVNELWGVFRYDDIEHVETHDDVFISSDTSKGGYRPNIPADPALLGTDNPLHAKRRKLVSRRFTPRAVTGHEEEVRHIVTSLLDAALAKDDVEIVDELASVLPARMIGQLLGFSRRRLAEAARLVRADDHAGRRASVHEPRRCRSRDGVHAGRAGPLRAAEAMSRG